LARIRRRAINDELAQIFDHGDISGAIHDRGDHDDEDQQRRDGEDPVIGKRGRKRRNFVLADLGPEPLGERLGWEAGKVLS
jgi:hypothetical protein